MGFIDYLLAGAILLALALAVRKCVRDHKNGKACNGDCAHCGHRCGK